MKIVREQSNYSSLKIELHEAWVRDWDMSVSHIQQKLQGLMPNAYKIDQIVMKEIRICKKNAKDVDRDKEELIWYETLDTLFSMRSHPLIKKKLYAREFFKHRINMVILELIKHIPFKRFIDTLFSKPSSAKQ